ncbi:MAG: DDE domain-containing protein [Mesorhizobium sp.]|nr:MAG: DDE domain-containing protein [Mesorhizobium sp.]
MSAHSGEDPVWPCQTNALTPVLLGTLKRVIRPTRGFQTMKTAYATIKGFEVMRMIRRGHCTQPSPGVTGEIRLVNELFGLAA